ncbi:MAG: Tfp pilus assembly protein PilF [Bryobacterales bacterium]|nr:Tfp pilus assembly protein PilF [Bryobacterales bacterium]
MFCCVLAFFLLPLQLPNTQRHTASYESYLLQGIQSQAQGQFAEAEEAYTAALNEVEKSLGSASTATAEVLINLGALRSTMRQIPAALSAFERALRITERAFGADHPQVGQVLTNVAMLHHQQSRYAVAEPLYRRALVILKNSLGTDNYDVAVTEAGLGKLLLVQARNSEAEGLLEKACLIFERRQTLGSLVICLANLAEAYRADGRYAKAESRYLRTLGILKNKPGLSTPEVSLAMRHFPEMLRSMKRKGEAREIQQELKTMLPQ